MFKLKAQFGHVIVGGGLFAHDSQLPLSLAWLAFGEKNGVGSLTEMRSRIRQYQSAEARLRDDPVIGCRLIQQPFFFPPEQWFRVPETFPVNAVSGKSWRLNELEGQLLTRAVEERLSWPPSPNFAPPLGGFSEADRTGPARTIFPRLGQGSFRIAVTDRYGRRCAVTGEKTLPLLDAAHIKPWAEGGQHSPGNGILLRTDVHRLFDLGYVTITHDHRFEVSPRLKQDYDNGKEYYELHGRKIREPSDPVFLPSREALDWHHSNRWSQPAATGLLA